MTGRPVGPFVPKNAPKSGSNPYTIRRRPVGPLIAAALALSSCAHTPEPRVIIQKAVIVTPVPCVVSEDASPPEIWTKERIEAIPEDNPHGVIMALWAAYNRGVIVERNLRAAMVGCARSP